MVTGKIGIRDARLREATSRAKRLYISNPDLEYVKRTTLAIMRAGLGLSRPTLLDYWNIIEARLQVDPEVQKASETAKAKRLNNYNV